MDMAMKSLNIIICGAEMFTTVRTSCIAKGCSLQLIFHAPVFWSKSPEPSPIAALEVSRKLQKHGAQTSSEL